MGGELVDCFQNPILPGFYPDPSICRVGEDYYLVTSTFSYFPGVPIFHSKDLVHWEQIGHVLDRPEQLDLTGLGHSQGIFAPTIRYYQGIFYLITTNVGKGGNFLVTARDPKGPWSDPVWLDAPGIDPSLFFDDDGQAYYCGTSSAPEGEKYYGNNEIFLQRLNLETLALEGPTYPLWRGALRDAVWPEAPHIYKKDGYYYLMIAEGGTGHHHAVTIARSQSIEGPYVGNPGNPILTHRHLGRDFPIVNTGHGDLVETQEGEWWMVLLASRPKGGYYRNLGRETFLAPVIWEDDWPIVSPNTGKVEWSYPLPRLRPSPHNTRGRKAVDDFARPTLELVWNCLRTPQESFYSLTERPGYLRLYLRKETLGELVNPSFIGRRQQHHSFTVTAALEFTPKQECEEAGLVALQSDAVHYRLVLGQQSGSPVVKLICRRDGKESLLASAHAPSGQVCLRILALDQSLDFYFGTNPRDLMPLYHDADGRILSTDYAGGFVGTYLGVYASSNGEESSNVADFDWFSYDGL